jgi:hypothetical protein
MKKPYVSILLLVLFLAACDEVLETVLTGKKVTLLAPVNNLNTTDTLQTFYWENLDGAVLYQLQIVSPRFDSITRLIMDTTIGRNTFSIDLDTGTYQWRVKALNFSTESGNSDTWNLKIH